MMIVIAAGFLGSHESFLRWLVYTDHIVSLVVHWLVGVFLTCVVLGSVIRPFFRRARAVLVAEWREHKQVQRMLVERLGPQAPAVRYTYNGGLDDRPGASGDGGGGGSASAESAGGV